MLLQNFQVLFGADLQINMFFIFLKFFMQISVLLSKYTCDLGHKFYTIKAHSSDYIIFEIEFLSLYL